MINNGFRAGVVFDEESPSDAGRTLEGCFIGTDASGTQDLGNSAGVIIDDGENNVIGGDTLAARNVISGNSNAGVFLSGPATISSIKATSSIPTRTGRIATWATVPAYTLQEDPTTS